MNFHVFLLVMCACQKMVLGQVESLFPSGFCIFQGCAAVRGPMPRMHSNTLQSRKFDP